MAALVKLTLFVLAVTTIAHAQRVVDAPRDMPPNLPWLPQWVKCDFDLEIFKNGPACNDCYSVLHCTPKGGVLRNCFGWTPYCVEGKCVNEPSADADCVDPEIVTDVYLNLDD